MKIIEGVELDPREFRKQTGLVPRYPGLHEVAYVTQLGAAKYGGDVATELAKLIGGKANPGRVLGRVERDNGYVSLLAAPSASGKDIDQISLGAVWNEGGRRPFSVAGKGEFWRKTLAPDADPKSVAKEIAKAFKAKYESVSRRSGLTEGTNLTSHEVERLPEGSIVVPAPGGKPDTNMALVRVPGGIAPTSILPKTTTSGVVPDGEGSAQFGNEFILVKKGNGKVPTHGTAYKLVMTWMRSL